MHNTPKNYHREIIKLWAYCTSVAPSGVIFWAYTILINGFTIDFSLEICYNSRVNERHSTISVTNVDDLSY